MSRAYTARFVDAVDATIAGNPIPHPLSRKAVTRVIIDGVFEWMLSTKSVLGGSGRLVCSFGDVLMAELAFGEAQYSRQGSDRFLQFFGDPDKDKVAGQDLLVVLQRKLPRQV